MLAVEGYIATWLSIAFHTAIIATSQAAGSNAIKDIVIALATGLVTRRSVRKHP